MPLLDHFTPPLSTSRHWESFHAGWAEQLAQQLNEILPPGLSSMPVGCAFCGWAARRPMDRSTASAVRVMVGSFRVKLTGTASASGYPTRPQGNGDTNVRAGTTVGS